MPNPKVANVAEYIIVVFTTPYSPYKSLPNRRAIKIPANSKNALPSPLPTTAQKESRAKTLFVILCIFTIFMQISSHNNPLPIRYPCFTLALPLRYPCIVHKMTIIYTFVYTIHIHIFTMPRLSRAYRTMRPSPRLPRRLPVAKRWCGAEPQDDN